MSLCLQSMTAWSFNFDARESGALPIGRHKVAAGRLRCNAWRSNAAEVAGASTTRAGAPTAL